MEEEQEETRLKEPQVTSLDPQERKLARKLRIERRLDAIRLQNIPEGEKEEPPVVKTALQVQLENSADLLEKLQVDAKEYVTNVRVASDSRETDRREDEGVKKSKIIEKLEEDAAAAQVAFDEVTSKWASIMTYNDPLAIHDDMISQKVNCDELIKKKDGIIAMLKDEVKQAGINFMLDQRKQNDDITSLSHRIEKQVTLMRKVYREQLQVIEDVIMSERQLLIDATNKRWEELHKKTDQEEELTTENKIEQQEEFEEEGRQLRVAHQEKYRETKIKLNNDIEELQRQFEDIKIFCLLNGEKLDYNYQIMRKREDENVIIKSQQKRRINKLNDAIITLRRKISSTKSSMQDEIERVTQEVKKLHHSVMDIEEKADYFTKINDMKYNQIWQFNTEKAKEVLKQILEIDRILYEQQLGVPWMPLERTLIKKQDLESYKSAIRTISEIYRNKFDNREEGVDDERSNTSSVMLDNSLKGDYKGETSAYRRLLKQILVLISDKAEFLVETRLCKILKPYSHDEVCLVRIDNVFMALQVNKKEDVELLIEYFLPYTHCPVCYLNDEETNSDSEKEVMVENLMVESTETVRTTLSTKGASTATTHIVDVMSAIHQPEGIINHILSTVVEAQPSAEDLSYEVPLAEVSGVSKFNINETLDLKSTKEFTESTLSEKMSCKMHHPLVISPVHVLRALKEFVHKFYSKAAGGPNMSQRLSNKRSTVSRLMVGSDIHLYWDRFRNIFSADREQIWDALLEGLKKYHEVLKDRRVLNDEVIVLRKENRELRHLLSSYRSADRKKRLEPPCAAQKQIPFRSSPTGRKL